METSPKIKLMDYAVAFCNLKFMEWAIIQDIPPSAKQICPNVDGIIIPRIKRRTPTMTKDMMPEFFLDRWRLIIEKYIKKPPRRRKMASKIPWLTSGNILNPT